MPLYDFKCRGCGHTFERLVRGGNAVECPSCMSTDVERLMSSFAFSVRSDGLSSAARRSVEKQQQQQHRDQMEYQKEIERKHLDD